MKNRVALVFRSFKIALRRCAELDDFLGENVGPHCPAVFARVCEIPYRSPIILRAIRIKKILIEHAWTKETARGPFQGNQPSGSNPTFGALA
jgi:hypothetical protein